MEAQRAETNLILKLFTGWERFEHILNTSHQGEKRLSHVFWAWVCIFASREWQCYQDQKFSLWVICKFSYRDWQCYQDLTLFSHKVVSTKWSCQCFPSSNWALCRRSSVIKVSTNSPNAQVQNCKKAIFPVQSYRKTNAQVQNYNKGQCSSPVDFWMYGFLYFWKFWVGCHISEMKRAKEICWCQNHRIF